MSSFNLLDKPFIPCVRQDGSTTEVDLPTALREARGIARVRAESPLVTIGLHRILLAVLHSVLRGPTSLKQWSEFWSAKAWPEELLARYFADKLDRFDLFHSRYPFFQIAGFTEGKRVGANKLAAEITETNVKLMFSHVSDDDPPVLPNAEVARQLIAHQLTTGQGGRGYGASPLSRAAVILAEGDDLFTTLHLNLIRYKTRDNNPIYNDESDAPAWETNSNPCTAPPTPDGLLDLYTWQSRSVLLIPESNEDGVRWMHYGPGRMFRPESTVFDPAMSFRETKDRTVRAVEFDEHKATWRDSGAILEFGDESRHRRPAWMEQFVQVRQDEREVGFRNCRFVVLGSLSASAKVKFWRHDALPLPLAYLEDLELVEQLKRCLALAEQVARALRAATYRAFIQIKRDSAPTKPAEGTAALDFTATNERLQKKKPDPIGQRVKLLAPERAYWSRLELRFHRLLPMLAAASGAEVRNHEVGRWFRENLTPLAKQAFEAVAKTLCGSQRELHGVAVGQNQLDRRLRKLGKQFPKPVNSPSEVSQDD